MENIVIGHFQGRSIYLRDVARVEDTIAERSQETYINGIRGGSIIIMKQAGANTVQICKKIKSLPELKKIFLPISG